MADVLVANTDVQLNGKTLLTAEDAIVSTAASPSSFTSYINQAGVLRATFFDTTNQSIPDNTLTTLTFVSSDENVGGFVFDGSSNLVLPQTGVYVVSAGAQFAAGGLAGTRRLIRLAGTSLGSRPTDSEISPGNTNQVVLEASAVTLFSGASQTITVQVLQSTGGALNVSNRVLRIVKVA